MNTKQSSMNWGYMDPDDLPQSPIIAEGKGELAVCIPTYCRKAIVEELLKTNMELFLKYGIDVYIYDSSDDDHTQLLVETWQKIYFNLYYVRFPPELHSNMKVYKIFQKYSLYKDYDYLWVCSDSIRWAEEVIIQVKNQLANGYDMIVINYRDESHSGEKEYCDPVFFAKECGWHLTLYGATVLNTHTMLENVNWKELQKKYNKPERVNHSHVCFYLEQIAALKKFSAKCLNYPRKVLMSTSLKRHSTWRKETFYVWGYCFPDAINALPQYYRKSVKKEIIKKNGKYGDVLDACNLLALRADGLYDMEIYKEYKKDWHALTDVPKWRLRKIARMSPEQVKKEQILQQIGKQKIDQHKKQINELRKFACRQKKLYIYGAGKCAIRYAGYLDNMQIKYEGFIVSEKGQNSTEINNHSVFALAELDLSGKNIGIILALNPTNQCQVKEILKERRIDKNVYSEYIVSI